MNIIGTSLIIVAIIGIIVAIISFFQGKSMSKDLIPGLLVLVFWGYLLKNENVNINDVFNFYKSNPLHIFLVLASIFAVILLVRFSYKTYAKYSEKRFQNVPFPEFRYNANEIEWFSKSENIYQLRLKSGLSIDFKTDYDEMFYIWLLTRNVKEYKISQNARS
jgi:hypothetical protein